VYDDDGTEPEKEAAAAPPTDDQTEEVLLPKFTSAIGMGMVALRILVYFSGNGKIRGRK
jgi:hypothetical protein